MSDFLLIVAVSLPALVGIVVLTWGALSLVTAFAVGRVLAEDDRPYDQERDVRQERAARSVLHPAPRLEGRGTPIDPPRRGTA